MATYIEDKKAAYVALASRVLVAARWNDNIPSPDWAAYIDAVPGERHSDEYEEVLRTGCKINYQIAALLFPSLDEKYRWRR